MSEALTREQVVESVTRWQMHYGLQTSFAKDYLDTDATLREQLTATKTTKDMLHTALTACEQQLAAIREQLNQALGVIEAREETLRQTREMNDQELARVMQQLAACEQERKAAHDRADREFHNVEVWCRKYKEVEQQLATMTQERDHIASLLECERTNREALNEIEFQANLMGLIFPKDDATHAECLKAVMDSHAALREQVAHLTSLLECERTDRADLFKQLAACEQKVNNLSMQKDDWEACCTAREQVEQQLATAQATITQRENEINELTRSIARIRTEEIAPLHEQHQRMKGEIDEWRTVTERFDMLKAELRDKEQQLQAAREAIMWALGYWSFRARKDGEGPYYWRKELRERAFPNGITEQDIKAYQAQAQAGQCSVSIPHPAHDACPGIPFQAQAGESRDAQAIRQLKTIPPQS